MQTPWKNRGKWAREEVSEDRQGRAAHPPVWTPAGAAVAFLGLTADAVPICLLQNGFRLSLDSSFVLSGHSHPD